MAGQPLPFVASRMLISLGKGVPRGWLLANRPFFRPPTSPRPTAPIDALALGRFVVPQSPSRSLARRPTGRFGGSVRSTRLRRHGTARHVVGPGVMGA